MTKSTGPPPSLSEARRLYRERAYGELLESLGVLATEELLREPELAFFAADAHRRLGDGDRALELTLQLAPVCAQRGNDRLGRDRLNLEGMLRFREGAVAEATDLWSELLDLASRAGDADFVARANHNLGVVFTLRGALDAALVSYERALSAYRQIGRWRGIAQALQNIAITYRELGRWMDADRCCQEAIRYAQQDRSDDEVARAQQERALVLCYQGDCLLARATATLALDAWTRLGQPSGLAATHQVLGIIALADRRTADARDHLLRALALARQANDVLVEAETLETQAVLALGDGQAAEGAALRVQAEQRFSALGAAGWGERLRARLEDLLLLPSTASDPENPPG